VTGRHAATLLAGLVLLVAAGGCARPPAERPVADPASQRTTRAGAVAGFVARYGSHAWLGIPYARPPVGALRWRAPEPPEPWTGTRAALALGAPCTQYASRLGGVATARPDTPVGSEDCLYLNVWAPRSAEAHPAAQWPVMLWIHGGGNTIGEGGLYDGGNLAATHGVVVVTVNYRLGPLGWFHHAALREDASKLERSGNFALLDLLEALAWVRDNAAAFGGDPSRVTIFGESAGGTNVFALLLAPQARGLFHRAIVQSGVLRITTPAAAEHLASDPEPGGPNSTSEALLRLLRADGTAPDRAGATAHLQALAPREVAHYLRDKSAREILAAYPPIRGVGMIAMPTLVGDGTVLPRERPLERLARADGYQQVPVILGTNRDENKLFLSQDPAWVRRLFCLLPRIRDETRYEATASHLSAMWKATGVDEPAARMRAAQGSGVYAYRFDWDEEPTKLGTDLSRLLGAAHGLEIPFVFGHFDLGPAASFLFTAENEPGRRALAAQAMSYWAEFAHRGTPGRGRSDELPAWTPWDDSTPGVPRFLVLDTPEGGGLRMSSETVTRAGVLAAIDGDPRLPAPRDRCTVLRLLATWSTAYTPEDYARREECRPYPLARRGGLG